jgi:glycosyltransferase involved in cell wall biosynthesis
MIREMERHRGEEPRSAAAPAELSTALAVGALERTVVAARSEDGTDANPVRWQSRGRVYLVIRQLAGRSGGAERLFCEMANMFAGAGYDVVCITCEASREAPFYALSQAVTRLNLWGKAARRAPWYRAVDRLAALYGGRTPLAPADWLAKNLYFLRRLQTVFATGAPDVVISFMPPANTVTLLAGALAGVRVIPTNHNVPEQDFASADRWDQNPIDKRLRLWALRHAARIHVLAPSFKEWFPQELRSNVVVLTNYVSPEFEQAPRSGERANEILAVGRLAPVKNYGQLLEAWAKLRSRHPSWRVVIYGVGPLLQPLREQAEALGIAGSVRFMGHSSEMLPVYSRAQIFCHPAHFEGFGLSAAEALACGLPVVAFSDCSGVNEFVRDHSNGLLVDRARGADALADALEALIVDQGLRAKLRKGAVASVSQISFAAFRERWINLVEEVRREPAPAPKLLLRD